MSALRQHLLSLEDRTGRPSVQEWFKITRRDPCPLCGKRMRGSGQHRDLATRDHIVPKSRGGGYNWENITAVCTSCNTAKSDLSLLGFLARHIPTPLPVVVPSETGSPCAKALVEAAYATFGPQLSYPGRGPASLRRALFWVARRHGVLEEVVRHLPARFRGDVDRIAELHPRPYLITRLQQAVARIDGPCQPTAPEEQGARSNFGA